MSLNEETPINVTAFFRDAEAFDALKNAVFPQITGKKSSDTPIRVWVPGCSTGEEAYWIAICLLEFLEDKETSQPVQIFATDLDASSIKTFVRVRVEKFQSDIFRELAKETLMV